MLGEVNFLLNSNVFYLFCAWHHFIIQVYFQLNGKYRILKPICGL